MKLSQLMHTISPKQLIIVREYDNNPPVKIFVKGTRKDIPKDSALNNYTVKEISYHQSYMSIGIIVPKNCKGGVLL